MAFYVDAFGKIKNSATQSQKTIDANKAAYEAKWGRPASRPLQNVATQPPKPMSASDQELRNLASQRPAYVDPRKIDLGQNQLYRQPGSGDSPWLSMMKQSQEAAMAQSRDQLGRQIGSQQQTAWDRMASSGGLSSGARERAAADAQMLGFEGQQRLGQEGRKTLADLAVADEDFNRQNQRLDVENRNAQAQRQLEYALRDWEMRGKLAASQSLGDLMKQYA